METLRLKELKPGMIIAEPVYNLNRVLLLKQGAMLTQKDMWILKTWGVSEVSIESEYKGPGNNNGPPQIKGRSTIANKLSEQFSEVSDDPVMMEIMRAAGKRLEKRVLDSMDEELSP